MRGINVIVCAALLLAAIAVGVLTEESVRWLAALLAFVAIFLAWQTLGSGIAEEETRTHTQPPENRLR